MAVREYVLKYGKDAVRFNLDSAWVARELTIKDYPPLENPPLAIREAIRKPIQSPPFKEIVKPGQKVAFLVNDGRHEPGIEIDLVLVRHLLGVLHDAASKLLLCVSVVG